MLKVPLEPKRSTISSESSDQGYGEDRRGSRSPSPTEMLDDVFEKFISAHLKPEQEGNGAPIMGPSQMIRSLIQRLEELDSKIKAMSRIPGTVDGQDASNTLIITNLPENKYETVSQLQELIADLMKALNIPEFQYKNAFRMGEPRAMRNRAVCLQLLNVDDKWSILNRKKLLQQTGDAKYAKVYINSDLSKEERRAHAELRQALKEAKEKDASVTGCIRSSTLYLRKDGEVVERFRWKGAGEIEKF